MMSPYLFIAPAKNKGLGVFTSETILAGAVIETAPVIVMTRQERFFLDQTLLHDYIFEWGNEKDQCCMALGYVPLYNHSYEANCDYEMDFENKIISIKAIRNIEAGEELMINYNGIWNDRRPVWLEKK